MEEWKAFPEANTLNKECYVITLNELINFIGMKVPDFDTGFIHEALERQKVWLKVVLPWYLMIMILSLFKMILSSTR